MISLNLFQTREIAEEILKKLHVLQKYGAPGIIGISKIRN